MRRLTVLPLIVFGPFFFPLPSLAQTREDSTCLQNEADILSEEDQTRVDLQSALKKYETEIGICRKIGGKTGPASRIARSALCTSSQCLVAEVVDLHCYALKMIITARSARLSPERSLVLPFAAEETPG